MPGGRPPKPTAIKQLGGTARADRANAYEPVPDVACPLPPEWASPKAREFWNEIGPVLLTLQVVSYADRTALTLLTEAYADWHELSLFVRDKGWTYEVTTESGGTMIRPRPEVAMRAEAWRQVDKMLNQFGLTPSSRSKVSTLKQALADPADDILNR